MRWGKRFLCVRCEGMAGYRTGADVNIPCPVPKVGMYACRLSDGRGKRRGVTCVRSVHLRGVVRYIFECIYEDLENKVGCD